MNILRKDTAKHYRSIHRLLHGNIPERLEDHEPRNNILEMVGWAVLVLIIITLLFVLPGCASAYTLDQYANAIYKAEHSIKHPYGIMIKCHNPRAVCKKTVWHKYQQWLKHGKQGLFIHYLASKYAPINCDNDVGTNQFWEKNVLYFLTLNK